MGPSQRSPRHWRTTITNKISAIPEKRGWQIATQGLTGTHIAINNGLKQAAWQNGFDGFNGPL
jgi:hypothetical protein